VRRGKEGRRRGERGEGEGGGKEEDPFCYDVVDVGSIEEVLEGDVWWVQVYVL